MIQSTKILTLIVFGLLFLKLSAQENNFSNNQVAKLPNKNPIFSEKGVSSNLNYLEVYCLKNE